MTDRTILYSATTSFILFLLMFYFLIESLTMNGWTFYSVLLAAFAARNFVNGVQMGKLYYEIQQIKNKKKK